MVKNQSETLNWLSDPLSEEVAKKLGDVSQLSKPNKGAIGIAGHFPIENSKLAVEIVRSGNQCGFENDQDHPELIVMNLTSNSSYESLRDQVRMLSDAGCDVIVIPESDFSQQQISLLEKETGGLSKIIYLKKDGNKKEEYQSLALRTLGEVSSISIKARPNIYDSGNYETIKKNLAQDISDRTKRISARSKRDGGYPAIKSILQDHSVVGVLGGAGPMASAQYSLDLAQKGIPHIHISNNSAPYKIKFAQRESHSFLSHYKNTLELLKSFGCTHCAMPCNTAHLPQFREVVFGNTELKDIKFINITDSVINYLDTESSSKKIILLGTDATVGIDRDGNAVEGLYDQCLKQNGYEVIKPNRAQQDEVMKAIYAAKAGRMEIARFIINEIVGQLKRDNGFGSEVILACTDLPIAFEINELNDIRAISTVKTLSDFTGKILTPTTSPLKRGFVSIEFSDSKRVKFTPPRHSESEGASVSDVSDDETAQPDSTKISSITRRYNLSFSKNGHNEMRIYFNKKDDSGEKSKSRNTDMHTFHKQFCTGLTSRLHLNKGYITFIGSGEEKFDRLNSFLSEHKIPENKQIEQGNVK